MEIIINQNNFECIKIKKQKYPEFNSIFVYIIFSNEKINYNNLLEILNENNDLTILKTGEEINFYHFYSNHINNKIKIGGKIN